VAEFTDPRLSVYQLFLLKMVKDVHLLSKTRRDQSITIDLPKSHFLIINIAAVEKVLGIYNNTVILAKELASLEKFFKLIRKNQQVDYTNGGYASHFPWSFGVNHFQ
jgi:hypothetical protein